MRRKSTRIDTTSQLNSYATSATRITSVDLTAIHASDRRSIIVRMRHDTLRKDLFVLSTRSYCLFTSIDKLPTGGVPLYAKASRFPSSAVNCRFPRDTIVVKLFLSKHMCVLCVAMAVNIEFGRCVCPARGRNCWRVVWKRSM